ncbi:hypothetical protein MIR68_005716 [Amoeboaphelidium protococcarum]|nr:hypothetical protein MIR68_005716 [Amoeboaphelidium protococcarum]
MEDDHGVFLYAKALCAVKARDTTEFHGPHQLVSFVSQTVRKAKLMVPTLPMSMFHLKTLYLVLILKMRLCGIQDQ